jgi:hypothetical protein
MRALGIALATALLAVALAGCPGPTFVVQQYTGPVRPKDTIATLRVNGSDTVRIATLDNEELGAPIASDSRLHIELLPGRHAVTAQSIGAAAEPGEPIVFQAEAGKVYRVAFVAGTPHLYEVDRDADAVVRDVTPVTPAPPPAPPPPLGFRR